MGRTLQNLSAQGVARLKEPKLYSDGGGLYLKVAKRVGSKNLTGVTKSWVFRYRRNGKDTPLGLGPYPEISLKDAREKALEYRRLKERGVDPKTYRDNQKARAENELEKTFRYCAEAHIKVNQSDWSSEKHSKQWRATLETYVYPALGDIPVVQVKVGHVVDVLKPIWVDKPETARRVRQRMEAVFNTAISEEWRAEANPASLRLLKNKLPKNRKTTRYHPSLPHWQIAAFYRILTQDESMSSQALQFTILTAARTVEVIGAHWVEINWDEKTWTVPAERHKTRRNHHVPLSKGAISILKARWRMRIGSGEDEYIFPGQNLGQPLSDMAMLTLLKRMGRRDITIHGFRSTFRVWTQEELVTDVGSQRQYAKHEQYLAEKALSHTIGNTVERRYARSELVEERRALMEDWWKYCSSELGYTSEDNIVPLA